MKSKWQMFFNGKWIDCSLHAAVLAQLVGVKTRKRGILSRLFNR